MSTFLPRVLAHVCIATASFLMMGCQGASVLSYKAVRASLDGLRVQQPGRALDLNDKGRAPVRVVSAHADTRGGVVLGVEWFSEAGQNQVDEDRFWRRIRMSRTSDRVSLFQGGQELPLDYVIRTSDFGEGLSISDFLPYPLSLPPSGEHPVFDVIVHSSSDGTCTHTAVWDLKAKEPLKEGKVKVLFKPSLLKEWGYGTQDSIEWELDVIRVD